MLVLSLQIPGCAKQQNNADLEKLKVVTEACKVQNKSFLQFPDSSVGKGICI